MYLYIDLTAEEKRMSATTQQKKQQGLFSPVVGPKWSRPKVEEECLWKVCSEKKKIEWKRIRRIMNIMNISVVFCKKQLLYQY